MEESSKQKYRISNTTGALMIGTAVFFDLLQFIFTWFAIGLLLSPLITIFAGLTFWLWFFIMGVPFWVKPSRLLTFSLTFLLELIPGLDALAFFGALWTVGIAILLFMVRLEDKSGISLRPKLPKISKLKNKKLSTPQIKETAPKELSRPKFTDIKRVDVENST